MNRSDARCPSCGCPQSPEWALDWPRPSDVIEVAAHLFGVSTVALTGDGRGEPLTTHRHVTMAACRLAGFSYPVIAHHFARDHTSVMSACRKVAGVAFRGREPRPDAPKLTEMAETIWNTTLAGRAS